MRKLKKNNGITLIALVITIIVMLILVSVSISMAVNGGLFNYAGKAVGDTENEIEKEKEIAKGEGIQVGDTWYASIDNYTKGILHSWKKSKNAEGEIIFTCEYHENESYKMGEELAYQPAEDGKTSTTLSAVKSGVAEYYAKYTSYPTEADLGTIGEIGENGEQTINKQTGLKWIVLGIENKDEDNIYETLLITTEEPVTIDGTNGLYIYGKAAYNYIPEELDRICGELYSNSTYGTARSMKIEDVNNALGYKAKGGLYTTSDGNLHYTEGFNTKLKDIEDSSEDEEGNKIKVLDIIAEDGVETPTGSGKDKLGEYVIDGYAYNLNGNNNQIKDLVDGTIYNITAKEKEIIFGANKEYTYLLASRGSVAYAYDGCAGFGSGYVGEGGAVSCDFFFYSSGYAYGFALPLRPVVSLKSKIPAIKTTNS